MDQSISIILETNPVMFEYDVHDMQRAIRWFQEMFGAEVVYGPTDCHTELGLPLKGARLALSLADETVRIQKGSRVF